MEEGFDSYGAELDEAYRSATRAVELDANDPLGQRVLGGVHLSRREFDLAEIHFRKAIALNPNSAVTLASSGFLFSYIGKAEEAIAHIEEAKRIDPHYEPSWYWTSLGLAHFVARQYDEAVVIFSRSTLRWYWVHAHLAAAHAHLGHMDPARKSAAETLLLKPDFTISTFAKYEPYKFEADRQHAAEGLRKAGLPE